MTSAVPLIRRTERSTAPALRSITILGATGSIGASTIDLIRRNRGRFRVEAVTAARNAGALAKLARELNVGFAAVAAPSCYAELKSALAGSGIAAGAGDEAVVEAAQRPADWGMGAITGAAGLGPAGRRGDGRDHGRGRLALDARGGRARRDRRARQQGNAGVRRQPVHAPRRR